MNTHATLAVVLRTIEFSETSLVVTLLTRDLGKVSALAKGARRLKGPFEGSLDLLSVCQVQLIAKSGDALDLLTESKLRRRFRGADRSLDRTYAGFYIAETLRFWLDDDQPHSDLFELTLATLHQIDGHGNVAATLLAFDCQCLRMLGHRPATERCVACDSRLERPADTKRHSRQAFSLEGIGVVCPNCLPRQSAVIYVRSRTIDVLEHLLSCREIRSPFSLGSLLPWVDETSYPELRALITRIMQTLMGRSLRMQSYLPSNLSSE